MKPLLMGLCGLFALAARAQDFAALVADRAAVERVYFAHRAGEKAPFDEALPPAQLAALARLDAKKRAVLRACYGIEITPAMLTEEVQRIDATTRAPEVLAELIRALGGDEGRFARTVARPIVVDRILRARFENDDALHAPQRHSSEEIRARLLAQKDEPLEKRIAFLKAAPGGEVIEASWLLDSQPGGEKSEQQHRIEELSPEMQKVLRTQLRQAGDASAVIETPGGFLLYLATSLSAHELRVVSFVIRKRGFDEWLIAQSVP